MKQSEIPTLDLLSCGEWQSRPALNVDGQTLRYQDLRELVEHCKNSLVKSGIRPGSRVASCEPNSQELVVLMLALMSLGAVIVPVNAHWPMTKVESWLAQVRADYLIRLPVLVKSLNSAELNHKADAPHSGFLIATSGSSGAEKAVFLSYENFLVSAKASQSILPLLAGDCWWLSLPLFHVGGIAILFRCFSQGGAVGLSASIDTTHVSMVPTQLYRGLNATLSLRQKMPKLKAVIIGGAPCVESLAAQAKKQNIPLYFTYGLSEMASMVTLLRADNRRISGSVGVVLPASALRINECSEIEVKGGSLFKGYLNEQGELNTALNVEGWFPTGDLGKLEKGELVLIGRIDNRFISAGENIQPENIERYLKNMPGIEEAVVLAVMSLEYGQVPVALLKLNAKAVYSKSVLENTVRSALGGLCVPSRWLALPKQKSSLKYRKKELIQSLDTLVDLF